MFGDSLGIDGYFGAKRIFEPLRAALLSDDGAYSSGLGRFVFLFREFGLEPLLVISDAAYDVGSGRFGLSFRQSDLKPSFVY